MSEQREQGFIVIHRRIQSSPEWLALRGEQRSVFVSILLLANWMPDYFWAGAEKVEVGRGELAHKVETIAEHAAVSYPVARRTVELLITRGVLQVSTRIGTRNGLRVLRVVNYERYQDLTHAAHNQSDEPHAAPAQRSHNALATREPREPREPGELFAPPAATRQESTPVTAAKKPREAKQSDPLHKPMAEALVAAFEAARGSVYGFQPRDAKAVQTILGFTREPAEAVRRFTVALGEAGFRRCDSIHELATKWNAYSLGTAANAPGGATAEVRRLKPQPAASHDEFKRIGGGRYAF